MLHSRRLFLEEGFYRPLCRRVGELSFRNLPEGGVLCDAGCGEGYYTQEISRFLEEEKREHTLLAFDVSKDAVRLTAGRMGKKGILFVASAFHLPLAEESVDVMLSLFSPYAEEEYLRVLKPGGVLLRAYPEREHLYSLKEAVYESPLKNEGEAQVSDGFERVLTERCTFPIRLFKGEQIQALFEMTPYARKTSPRDREKLFGLQELDTVADFGIQILKKR